MKSYQYVRLEEGEDDSDSTLVDDVVCPIGQQLIGILLGALLAYICLLIFGNSILILSFSLSIGSSFGLLAAAVTYPTDILFRDFLIILSIDESLSLLCLTLIGCESLLSVVVLSTIVTAVSSLVWKFLLLTGTVIRVKNVSRRLSDD